MTPAPSAGVRTMRATCFLTGTVRTTSPREPNHMDRHRTRRHDRHVPAEPAADPTSLAICYTHAFGRHVAQTGNQPASVAHPGISLSTRPARRGEVQPRVDYLVYQIMAQGVLSVMLPRPAIRQHPAQRNPTALSSRPESHLCRLQLGPRRQQLSCQLTTMKAMITSCVGSIAKAMHPVPADPPHYDAQQRKETV